MISMARASGDQQYDTDTSLLIALGYLDIMREVEKKGFKKINLLAGLNIKNQSLTSRGTILYGRAGQKVWREIVSFSAS